MHGSPAINSWNTLLAKNVHDFASSYGSDITGLIFSAHALFGRVLDNPETYSFQESDIAKNGGAIWVDHLHPTTKMHAIIAADMAAFLEDVPAGESRST